MEKLVDDIELGEHVEYKGRTLLITDFYEANGEGRGFITTDDNGKEFKFSKSFGTLLKVVSDVK